MSASVSRSTGWTFRASEMPAFHAFFQAEGYAGLGDLLTAEDLKKLRGAFDEAERRGDIQVGDEKMLECQDVIFLHPVFEAYAKDPRLVKLASSLLGRPVELQHSKLNSKPMSDRAGLIQWHQDFPFFPHTNFDLVAVALHLDDETADSGPIEVLPGTHKRGPLTHCKQGEFLYEVTAPIDFENSPKVRLTGGAGLVTAHHCLIVHRSLPKKQAANRRVLVFEYRAQDAVQLAGVVWKSTGYQVQPWAPEKGTARFPDGTAVEIRGTTGRLYDKFSKLAPNQ